MANVKLENDLKHILNHTQPVWQEIAGKTILLTGGTGFFGKWLLESFLYANETLSLNARMLVLSRDPALFLSAFPAFSVPAITFIKGDIRNFSYPDGEIDYIIHTATEVSIPLNNEQPLHMFDTIAEGTRHVLELARIKKVKAVLHTSSGAVYGKQPSDLHDIKEDFIGGQDIYERGAAYGEGKRVAEMLAKIYSDSYGVTSKIARCFAFVGPYLPLDTHFAIGNFILNILNDEKIIIKGDGTPYRSYLYAADLAIWLWHILVFGEDCRPYNVGSDVALTIEDLAHMVASLGANAKDKVEILTPKTGRPAARYIPGINRAGEELNLKVNIDLKEAIRKTIEFYA